MPARRQKGIALAWPVSGRMSGRPWRLHPDRTCRSASMCASPPPPAPVFNRPVPTEPCRSRDAKRRFGQRPYIAP